MLPFLSFTLLSAALAQDFTALEVDVSDLPDLLESLRTPAPVMGECPLGLHDTLAPGEHLLHLGTTGFYLDYQARLALSPEQIEQLTAIRDDALGRGSALDLRIAAKETDLWTLTGAYPLDGDAVDAAVRELEALQVQRRLLYIDAVSKAASVLTSEQINVLVGR